MKNKNFEDYLKDWHAKGYHGTDDAMPDAFEKWLCELEVSELINFADIYGLECNKEGYTEAKDMALEVIRSPNT